MNTDKILHYQLTSIGGLEDVVADELKELLGSRVQALRIERGEVGRLYFRTEASPPRLQQLQCPTAIEAIALQAHDVTVGQPGLQRILQVIGKLPVQTMRRLACACDDDIVPERLQLRVTSSGAHRFSAEDVERGALPILQRQGFELGVPKPESGPESRPGRALRMAVRVQGKRVLVAVHLGPRRPMGDPQTEGWAGPAEHSVRRLLDLDADLVVGGIPAAPGRPLGFALHQAGAENILRTASTEAELPLRTGALPVLLMVPGAASDVAAVQLQEAVRAVTPGGIVAVLTRQPELFVPLLRDLGLPLEVMASLPYYVRRRRCALFLLERLELLGIELA